MELVEEVADWGPLPNIRHLSDTHPGLHILNNISHTEKSYLEQDFVPTVDWEHDWVCEDMRDLPI